MCVRRIQSIGKIFWPAIDQKESLAPEVVATAKRISQSLEAFSAHPLRTLRLCGEFVLVTGFDGGSHTLNDPRKTRQHKRRMKIVRPALITIYSVSPRPILALAPRHITRGVQIGFISECPQSFDESARREGRRHDCGRAARRKERTRLPVKVVSPARGAAL